MKIIVSKNNDTWTGILLNKGKLALTTYLCKSLEDAVNYLVQYAKEECDVEEGEHLIIDAINGIANGTSFDLPKIIFDFHGYTEKEIVVLKTLLKVPAGEVVSYGELAKRAGIPNAARFIGNVMAKNRFAPIIPCHRVILSSGKLGHFSGREGPKLKKRLLEQEQKKGTSIKHWLG
ncbi:MAG: methylated-DNA--[protein]-cysteine S-methyltransferase [Candidatus Hodarchaeota archaeon]